MKKATNCNYKPFMKGFITFLFICFSLISFGQKQVGDYTLAELEKGKANCVSQGRPDDEPVFEKAISIRKEMEAATIAEDYTKAASLKQQLKALRLPSQGEQEIEQLKAEIKKAVDAEEYDKAAALNKKLENLKNNKTEPAGSASGSSSSSSKSIPQLEFMNQVYFWKKSDNSIVSLEYDTPELKTATSVGFGYAQATSYWTVSGTESNVRLDLDENSGFILKVAPGINPQDLFRLIKFEIRGKVEPCRHLAAYTSTSAAYAGSSTRARTENDMPVSYNKLADGIYEVVINGRLSPGEYSFYGLNKMYSFSIGRSFTGNSSSSNNSSASGNTSSGSAAAASTAYTKADIYRESSITWYGTDFSLFTYTFARKSGFESEFLKHIDTWQRQFDKGMPSNKLANWLKKSNVTSDKDFTQSLYRTHIKQNWITTDFHTISTSEIQDHLANYRSGGRGIGLVLLPELFDEDRNEYTVEFVWFDTETKAIITTQKITDRGSGGPTLSGWIGVLNEATKIYVDRFYRAERGY